jgi:hypothetical protein
MDGEDVTDEEAHEEHGRVGATAQHLHSGEPRDGADVACGGVKRLDAAENEVAEKVDDEDEDDDVEDEEEDKDDDEDDDDDAVGREEEEEADAEVDEDETDVGWRECAADPGPPRRMPNV